MPYYSAKQPEKVRPSVSEDKQVGSAMFGPRGGNYSRLHLYRDEHIAIGKPRLDRIIAGVSSKSLTVASLWMGGSLILFGLHPLRSGNAVSHAVSASMISLASLSLWLLAGPDDLDLDLRQRTYRYRRRLLYFALTLTGTFEDILTVEVQCIGDTYRPQYLLMLIWNIPRRRRTCLGQFQTLEQANVQRSLILEKLAL